MFHTALLLLISFSTVFTLECTEQGFREYLNDYPFKYEGLIDDYIQ